MRVPPFMVQGMFPGLVWKLPPSDHSVFLTFDDGPTPGITERILELLDAGNNRATFFCIGRNAERNPQLLNLIKSRGHSIGNHTYSHLNGFKTSNTVYFDDVQLAEQFTPSNLFRPPYGMIRPSQARQLKKCFSIIMWSCMSYDFDPHITPETCLKTVLSSLQPGSIVVFHDSLKASEKMLYALPRVLDYLQEHGMHARSIEGCQP